jgi:hypothetical protein
MLLSFSKGRGEFWVDVAPAHASAAWQEIGSLLASLDSNIEIPRRYAVSSFGPLRRANFARLEAVVSVDAQRAAKWTPPSTRIIEL